ncbi:MAG: TolC family protein [Deltaproteobacteria bacterium]|nr:TolC family protein [Deltaproteobacteria bacterium]
MSGNWRFSSGVFMLFLLAVLFAASSAEAQEEDRHFTLERCVREALSNNWGVKARQERIEESTYVKEQAKADFLPKLSTSFGYTRMDDVRYSNSVPLGGGLFIPGRPQNTEDNYTWRTSLRQPLFTGFALLSAYELAKLGVDRSEMELELEKLDLVLQAKESYFNILRADKGVEVGRMDVESRESHVEVAKNFYDVGIIPINDLLKAEVELANSRQALVKVENAAALVRASFNRLLARPVNLPVEVEPMWTYVPETVDFDQAMNRAVQQRPEIRLVDLAIQQADQQIRLAKSKFYPEVSFVFDYIKEGDQWDVSGDDFHDPDRWQATALLSWTFWEWGKTVSAAREKLSARKQLMINKAGLVDGVSLEIRQAALELDQTEKNIPTTKKAVEQAEENLRVNQERYKAQVTTMTEVLDAQTLLTQARVNYYTALIEHQVAKARLQRAMGEN